MAELADFFARLDAVIEAEEGGQVDPSELTDDDVVTRRGEQLRHLYEKRAERAGIELVELVEIIRDRCDDTAEAVRQRVTEQLQHLLGEGEIADDDIDRGELVGLAAAAGMQFFLAGVLWEQDRHLPDIGDWTP